MLRYSGRLYPAISSKMIQALLIVVNSSKGEVLFKAIFTGSSSALKICSKEDFDSSNYPQAISIASLISLVLTSLSSLLNTHIGLLDSSSSSPSEASYSFFIIYMFKLGLAFISSNQGFPF